MIIQNDVLSFNIDSKYFNRLSSVDEVNITRYLKGVFRENKPRFQKRFAEFYRKCFKAYEIEYMEYLIDNIEYIWDHVQPFSYKEAFEIQDNNFRIIVFSSINIREMIEELGSTRVAVEGKELINKTWNPIKNEFEEIPYTVVYELHHVDGEKLGAREGTKFAIIKCWCTSTNNEHWLWADDRFLEENSSPLEAITSTCVIYKSMKGKIKHIIRQGDVFLFEMTEDVTPSENEPTINLSMQEYFSLLKSQA